MKQDGMHIQSHTDNKNYGPKWTPYGNQTNWKWIGTITWNPKEHMRLLETPKSTQETPMEALTYLKESNSIIIRRIS